MNALFFLLVCAACFSLLFTAPQAVLSAMLGGAEKALTLCLSLAAVYAVWMGVLELLQRAEAHKKLAKGCGPLLRFLFGELPPNAADFLTLNLSSTLLGLGSVATPAGVECAKMMEGAFLAAPSPNARAVYERRTTALFLLNTCTLQLLPTSVISLRASLGSATPADTLAASLFSGMISLLCAVIIIRLHRRFCEKKEAKTHTAGGAVVQNRGQNGTFSNTSIKKKEKKSDAFSDHSAARTEKRSNAISDVDKARNGDLK